jgi:hypothetical protein
VVWYEGGDCSIREVVSDTDALRDVDMRRGKKGGLGLVKLLWVL